MDTTLAGGDPFADPKFGHALTRAIVDTIHEPFLVLDSDLRIIVASRSFYKMFNVAKEDTQGRYLYELGNGQWDIPALRHFLNNIVPDHSVMSEYKVVHDFVSIGPRTMLLSAREVLYENSQRKNLLLTISDITGAELLEREKEKLSDQKDIMIKEMKHRMANSLQLIASILILKANTIESLEARGHLEDAHQRIISIAEVERHLQPKDFGHEVDMGPYLADLSESLSNSMIADRPITLEVGGSGGMATPTEAISLGLVTAELVINALKHAFPDGKVGKICVDYDATGREWTLSISDNGVGITENPNRKAGGLGTSIIASLAHQLKAMVETETSSKGTKVSILKSSQVENVPQPVLLA